MDTIKQHLKLINAQLEAYLDEHVTSTFSIELCDAAPITKPKTKGMHAAGSLPKEEIRCFEPDDILQEKECTLENNITLDDYLQKERETFQQMLFRVIEEKHLKAVDVYKKANMSKQTFSKIRWDEDYHPHKRTAIALAIALELDVKETSEFLSKAGYTLKSSLVEDMVVQFFIENKIYNLLEIDTALYDRHLPTISNY